MPQVGLYHNDTLAPINGYAIEKVVGSQFVDVTLNEALAKNGLQAYRVDEIISIQSQALMLPVSMHYAKVKDSG